MGILPDVGTDRGGDPDANSRSVPNGNILMRGISDHATSYSARMRIAVSGTHASGKSTLISDFVGTHPEYAALPDPFELIDESDDAPNRQSFLTQLQASAERLSGDESPPDYIAERCPLDFLAYLAALELLDGQILRDDVAARAEAISAAALCQLDVLVILPLNSADAIWVPEEENRPLREAMNEALLELSDDPDRVGDRPRVVELTGNRERRLAQLETTIAAVEARHLTGH